MDFLLSILQDAFFGGLAGIGFASISNPPNNAYKYCFVISAVGHAIRFVLMNNSYYHFGLIIASFVAALSIGFNCTYGTKSQMSTRNILISIIITNDSWNVCLSHHRRTGNVFIYRKRRFIRPLFVSLHIEWLYLCIRHLWNGIGGNYAYLYLK